MMRTSFAASLGSLVLFPYNVGIIAARELGRYGLITSSAWPLKNYLVHCAHNDWGLS